MSEEIMGFEITKNDLTTGKIVINNIEITSIEDWNKVIHSITKLQQENQELNSRIKSLNHIVNTLQQENQQLKELYDKALSDDVKTTKILMDLEKWLKEDLGVIYTAESMSGKVFTTAKEVTVIDILKKINELKGVDE